MPPRIAFDLDGTLADFAGAYGRIADGLFPGWRGGGAPPADAAADEPTPADAAPDEPAAPDSAPDEPPPPGAAQRLSRRRQEAVWRSIRSTSDFWLTLEPIDPEAIPRLHERASRLGWDTFFVTQRPATAGASVQQQTQRWLAEQGFALPSVIVHAGSRGRLAAALELDFLVDDTVQHCVDALSESAATPILVDAAPDPATAANARRLGIELCAGPAESLELIERAAASGTLRSLARGARRRLRW